MAKKNTIKKGELPITVKLLITRTDPSINEFNFIKGGAMEQTIKSLRETGYNTLPGSIYNLVIYDSYIGNLSRNIGRTDTLISVIDVTDNIKSDIETIIKNAPVSKPTDENPHVTYVMIEGTHAYAFSSALREMGYTTQSIFPMGRK